MFLYTDIWDNLALYHVLEQAPNNPHITMATPYIRVHGCRHDRV